MSAEQYRSHENTAEAHEIDKDLLHEREKNLEKIIEKGEKQKESESKKTIEHLRENVEDTAKSRSEKLNSEIDENQSSAPSTTVYTQNVKKAAYNKELNRARKHMSKPQKTFSKFIHNPTIESVSEFSSKTVARPSGLLGGGIFAAFGTITLYIMSRYYGFEYNFFIYIILLVLGFLIGVCVELIVYPLIKKQ